ncbi:MAG: FAD:protein FMN transferase [Patescibacteria group bacterium]
MKQARFIMGMPITIEIVDATATQEDFEAVFSYFRSIDEQFSPYKATSEVTRINNGEIKENDYSKEMREVLVLAEVT